MGDQRIEMRPALGSEDPRHRLGIGGIGPQAIDRLGAESDQFAGTEQGGSLRDGVRRGEKKLGHVDAAMKAGFSKPGLP